MAREDILGGLKSALMRGYSLKDAMISFYNAGYSKEDIEESARTLQYQMVEHPELKDLLMSNHEKLMTPGSFPESSAKGKPGQKLKPGEKPVESKGLVPEKNLAPGTKPSEVSSGVQKGKFKSLKNFQPHPIPGPKEKKNLPKYKQGTGLRVATLTLVALLVILLGALAAIFLFRNQIISFFNNLLK